jgi:hypothetical protein
MYYTWAILGLILSIAVCIYALWRGGPAERYGAAIYLAGWALTTLVEGQYGSFKPAVMAVDTATLVAFVVLALWARKIWTLLIAACQLDAVLSHVAVLLAPKFDSVSYITVVGFWGGYGLLVCLAVGTYSYRRERRAEKRTEARAGTRSLHP